MAWQQFLSDDPPGLRRLDFISDDEGEPAAKVPRPVRKQRALRTRGSTHAPVGRGLGHGAHQGQEDPVAAVAAADVVTGVRTGAHGPIGAADPPGADDESMRSSDSGGRGADDDDFPHDLGGTRPPQPNPEPQRRQYPPLPPGGRWFRDLATGKFMYALESSEAAAWASDEVLPAPAGEAQAPPAGHPVERVPLGPAPQAAPAPAAPGRGEPDVVDALNALRGVPPPAASATVAGLNTLRNGAGGNMTDKFKVRVGELLKHVLRVYGGDTAVPDSRIILSYIGPPVRRPTSRVRREGRTYRDHRCTRMGVPRADGADACRLCPHILATIDPDLPPNASCGRFELPQEAPSRFHPAEYRKLAKTAVAAASALLHHAHLVLHGCAAFEARATAEREAAEGEVEEDSCDEEVSAVAHTRTQTLYADISRQAMALFADRLGFDRSRVAQSLVPAEDLDPRPVVPGPDGGGGNYLAVPMVIPAPCITDEVQSWKRMGRPRPNP